MKGERQRSVLEEKKGVGRKRRGEVMKTERDEERAESGGRRGGRGKGAGVPLQNDEGLLEESG